MQNVHVWDVGDFVRPENNSSKMKDVSMKDIIVINGVKYKRIEEEQKPTGWERSDEYCPLWNDGSGIHGEYIAMFDWNNLVEDTRYNAGMYFSDKELAQNMTRAVSLFLKMSRFAAEHQKILLDWTDTDYESRVKKWRISYNYVTEDIDTYDILYTRDLFNVYFDSEEAARAAIEEFHDDIIWYFTKFKNTVRF